MWEAIAKILTNSNALLVLLFLTLFVAILIVLAKSGLVQIKTGAFRMGADHRERDIIRQQIEWSHAYIMGLKPFITPDESKYNGFLTMYVLEACYDEVINWIAFNHINLDSAYISIKQEKIRGLLRAMPIGAEFHTKEFERKTDKWVEEIIKQLVTIREVYK